MPKKKKAKIEKEKPKKKTEKKEISAPNEVKKKKALPMPSKKLFRKMVKRDPLTSFGILSFLFSLLLLLFLFSSFSYITIITH